MLFFPQHTFEFYGLTIFISSKCKQHGSVVLKLPNHVLLRNTVHKCSFTSLIHALSCFSTTIFIMVAVKMRMFIV